MATKYFPSESGSSNTRGILTYSTSQTATTLTLTVSAVLQANGVYGSGYNCKIKIAGTTEKDVTDHKDPPAVAGWTTFLQTGTVTIPYTRTTSDQTITIEASFSGQSHEGWDAGTGSGSTTVTITVPALDAPQVTQTLNTKTGTSIKMNWSSNITVDYVWYSTNGGTSWTAVGSVNSTSGNYTIAGLSANTTYNVKTRLRGKASQASGDSSALSVKTYAAPTVTQSMDSKTGTSIRMNWSSTETTEQLWYSTNGGTSWTDKGAITGTSGTYLITGLSTGTAYSVKTRIRGKNSQMIADTSASSITTYTAPTITQSVSTKTDTTIKINWSANGTTCDYLFYSINGGSSFVTIGDINASSGSYTISGLTADTTYSIVTRARGKNAAVFSNSSALSVKTYGYPSVNQSVSSKTATSITMAWSSDSTCDYVWYSKNGGSTWTAVGSVNGKSGTYTISGLANETTYQILTRLRRTDSQYKADSTVLTVTTYGYPTVSQTLSTKTETTIRIDWSSDNTCDALWYSTDGGTNWTSIGGTFSSKSGTYVITGLSANTSYSVKTRLRRKDSQLTKDSSAISVKTYDYPHVTNAPNFTIGNSVKITLYNPLSRSCSVTITAVDSSTKSAGTVSGTTLEGLNTAAWKTFFYDSIPSATSGTYSVTVTYSGHSEQAAGGTYSINTSDSKPTITGLAYLDTNGSTTAVTLNDQKIVQTLSTVRYTASGLSAKNSATIASVKVTVNGSTYNMTVSGTSATGGNASIDSASNVTATATITDSRGLTATKSVTVQMLSWSLPSGIITLHRLSNFYTESYLKVDAVYSSVNSKNTISISYTGTAKPRTGKVTPAGVSGTLTDNVQTTLQLDNEFDWNFTITLVDKFGTTTYTRVLARGTPIIFFDDILNSTGVNKFPLNPDALEFDSAFYYGKGLGQYMFTPKQTSSNLSSAGWYRIMHLSGTDAYTRGNDAWCIDLTIGSAYNNARNVFHKITLLGAYNTFAFTDETSQAIVASENVVTKVRYMTDGSGNGYIDIYYDSATSNRVTIDFVLRPLSNGITEAVAFTAVNASPAGETQRAEHTFKGNYNEHDDRYYKTGDTETFSTYFCAGGIYNTAKRIYFTVTTPKRLDNISTVSVSTLKGRISGVNGLIESSSTTYDWTSGYTITVSATGKDYITIRIDKSSTLSNATVDTPVVVYLGTLTLSFS